MSKMLKFWTVYPEDISSYFSGNQLQSAAISEWLETVPVVVRNSTSTCIELELFRFKKNHFESCLIIDQSKFVHFRARLKVVNIRLVIPYP